MTEAIIVTLVPEQDQFHDLADFIQSLQPSTRSFPGCVTTHVCLDPAANEIVLFQIWQNSERHDAYLTWRAEQGVFDRAGAMLSAEEQHRAYQLA